MHHRATLTELTLYPIKSCAGMALTEATITTTGLLHRGVHDREWMVVDPQGRFLTQREHGVMAMIAPRLIDDMLEVRIPGKTPLRLPVALHASAEQARPLEVQVWDDAVRALDCGEAAAQWFSEALGTPCRLARFHPQATRLADPAWTDGIEAPTRFADGYPMLLVYEESLTEVNARLRKLGRAPLPMNRFRPNLVLAGAEAFEEEYAASFSTGDVVLKPVKPCPRCPIPSIDQTTGVSGPDPRDVLRSYRSDPRLSGAVTFGMNTILLAGEHSVLHTGQRIDIALDFDA